MTDEKNGTTLLDEDDPPAPIANEQVNGARPADQNQVELFIQDRCDMIAAMTVSGLASIFNALPLDRVFIGLAGAIGRTLGRATMLGDLVPQLTVRRHMKEAFSNGMAQFKIMPAPGRQPQNGVRKG